MAKDVITRFKLETTQYDSKIKNAAKELSDIAKSAKSAGGDFERFTKDSMEAARSLGAGFFGCLYRCSGQMERFYKAADAMGLGFTV